MASTRLSASSNPLEAATEAAYRAGNEVLKAYKSIQKDSHTRAQQALPGIIRQSEKTLYETLRKSTPGYRISSKLGGEPLRDTPQNSWVVHPLDAPQALIHNVGQHVPSIMLALREDMETRLGILLFPLSSVMYHAELGKGAYQDGKMINLQTKSSLHLHQAHVDLQQYSNASRETDFFKKTDTALRSNNGAQLVTRSASHAGMIANLLDPKTTLSAIIQDNNPKEPLIGIWEKIPTTLLLEEAGCVIRNAQYKAPKLFNDEPYIQAVSEHMVRSILEISKKFEWDDTSRAWSIK